jgi:Rrf2 family protein
MMTISTRGRYATRIMVLLASAGSETPVTKFQIAEAEAISPAYVQQLMMALRMAGLVFSHRGRVGGFSLSRSPDAITVSDVLKAVEGDVMPAPCRETGHCDRMATCPTRPVWEEAAELLDGLFGATTIASLAEGRVPRSADQAQEQPGA